MNAYAVTARLDGPVALLFPPHLDSLLYAARERRDGGTDLSPLDCLASTGGVYRASAGFLICEGPYGARTSSMGRVWRFRMEDPRFLDAVGVDGDTPTKYRKIGPMSPLRPKLRAQRTVEGVQALAWHFVGDGDGVLDLLRHVEGVGASSGTGRGRVIGWDLREVGGDPEGHGLVLGGKVVRNLPISVAAKALGRPVHPSETTPARVAPPYWDPTSRRPCLVPSLADMTYGADAFEEAA